MSKTIKHDDEHEVIRVIDNLTDEIVNTFDIEFLESISDEIDKYSAWPDLYNAWQFYKNEVKNNG